MTHLHELVAGLPPGDVPKEALIDRLLADCWDDLDGCDEGGMEPHKLLGRMEQVVWEPPVLSFVIERHGGLACGSTRAELQHWEVNIERNEARIVKEGHQQVKPMAPRNPIKATAEEIVRLIFARRDDERLYRQTDGTVKVLARKIYPEGSGFKRTVEGRRKRLCEYIESALARHGWTKQGWNVFLPPNKGMTRCS